jgi:hypothetical protein
MGTNPSAQRRGSRNRPRWIFVLLAVIILSTLAIVVFLSVSGTSLVPPPNTTTLSVLSGSQVVQPSNYIYFTFTLGDRYLSNYLIGNFTSSGSGGDNGIRMFLFNETNFKIFQSTGIAVGVIYETGLVSSGNLDVKLPQIDAEYVVVFDNSLDVSNSKTISGSIYLISSNPG